MGLYVPEFKKGVDRFELLYRYIDTLAYEALRQSGHTSGQAVMILHARDKEDQI